MLLETLTLDLSMISQKEIKHDNIITESQNPKQ